MGPITSGASSSQFTPDRGDGSLLELRPERSRGRSEFISVAEVYRMAIQNRVLKARLVKAREAKAKKEAKAKERKFGHLIRTPLRK